MFIISDPILVNIHGFIDNIDNIIFIVVEVRSIYRLIIIITFYSNKIIEVIAITRLGRILGLTIDEYRYIIVV